MPRRHAYRRIRATVLQPLLTFTARRNAKARAVAATLRLPCSACRASLASHVGTGNRWRGCRKVGAR
jgi:hypothetical protein